MSTNNIKLERLLEGLELAGVTKRGRNRDVAEKTKYSLSMVARVLTDNAVLTDRFISAVCSAYSISKPFVERGFGLWYENDSEKRLVSNEDAQLIESLNDSVVLREAMKELVLMSEPRRWEAVAALKRMNSEPDQS
jgi:hypothetical protein